MQKEIKRLYFYLNFSLNFTSQSLIYKNDFKRKDEENEKVFLYKQVSDQSVMQELQDFNYKLHIENK